MTDDQENVWRTLQDKDQIIGKGCKWGFHRWTKWKLQSKANREHETNVGYGRDYVYHGFCVKCLKPRSMRIWMDEESGAV